MSVIDLKHATIAIRDGTTPTPNVLELRIGEGNLSYTEAKNIEYRLNRGIIDTVREGDQVPLDLSIDFIWDFLRSMGSDPPTIEEAFKRTGNANDWVSSSADLCEPYAVDIVVTYNPQCPGVDQEVIVFQDFRWESLDHSVKDGSVAVKGKCNVLEALITRVANLSAATTATSSVSATGVTVTVTPTGGITPLSYQFQQAPDASGSPGTWASIGSPQPTNVKAVTGLTTATKYWFRAAVTDSSEPPTTINSTQTSVTTS
jgi:hypothetical protein